MGVICDEAGDCSKTAGNFRGVCPLSDLFPAGNRAAEAPDTAYITRKGTASGESRFVFRTGFDTHGWVYKSFTRAKPGRANAANQIRNGGTTTWQTKR